MMNMIILAGKKVNDIYKILHVFSFQSNLKQYQKASSH